MVHPYNDGSLMFLINHCQLHRQNKDYENDNGTVKLENRQDNGVC